MQQPAPVRTLPKCLPFHKCVVLILWLFLIFLTLPTGVSNVDPPWDLWVWGMPPLSCFSYNSSSSHQQAWIFGLNVWTWRKPDAAATDTGSVERLVLFPVFFLSLTTPMHRMAFHQWNPHDDLPLQAWNNACTRAGTSLLSVFLFLSFFLLSLLLRHRPNAAQMPEHTWRQCCGPQPVPTDMAPTVAQKSVPMFGHFWKNDLT